MPVLSRVRESACRPPRSRRHIAARTWEAQPLIELDAGKGCMAARAQVHARLLKCQDGGRQEKKEQRVYLRNPRSTPLAVDHD